MKHALCKVEFIAPSMREADLALDEIEQYLGDKGYIFKLGTSEETNE